MQATRLPNDVKAGPTKADGLDPRKIPAKPAWEVGREIAADTLVRHRDEQGEYPEEIGVVAWGTPTVRTRGETVAQVLATMGVEPVWTDAGRIDDVEPIPLGELGRPRVDVTTRVSGLFSGAATRSDRAGPPRRHTTRSSAGWIASRRP